VKLAPLAAALVVAIALAGCTTAPSDEPMSTPTPASTELPGAGVITGLSFAQGNDLGTDTADSPTFINLFPDDDDWTQADTTDPENGFWQYVSSDGKCAVSLSQLLIGDSFAITPDDDRATSLTALEWFYRNAPEIGPQVPTGAVDGILPFGIGWQQGLPGTDVVGIAAESDDGSVIVGYARAFGKPGVVLFLEITCTDGASYAANGESALLNGTVGSG
jgi:hypothetical protein